MIFFFLRVVLLACRRYSLRVLLWAGVGAVVSPKVLRLRGCWFCGSLDSAGMLGVTGRSDRGLLHFRKLQMTAVEVIIKPFCDIPLINFFRVMIPTNIRVTMQIDGGKTRATKIVTGLGSGKTVPVLNTMEVFPACLLHCILPP